MKLVKKIFDFYIKSSLHVALAIVSFVKVTELSLNISFSSHLILAIFFGSVVGYNFLKYEGFWLSKKFNFQKNIGVFFVTMVAFLFFVFYFFQLCRSQQVAFVSSAFLVLFYPFLRKYWFFKIGMVSFCVTFVVSCIPLLSASSMELSDTWFSLKLFVLIGALMLPFEIYDSQFDALTLQTIPQKFGARKAKQMGYVFLLIFLLVCIFSFQNNFISNRSFYSCSRWNFDIFCIGKKLKILHKFLGRSDSDFLVVDVSSCWSVFDVNLYSF